MPSSLIAIIVMIIIAIEAINGIAEKYHSIGKTLTLI
jgi:hypothetical protein